MKAADRIGIGILILAILAFFIWFFFLRAKPVPVTLAEKPSVTKPVEKPKVEKAIIDKRHLTVDGLLRKYRSQIGQCLLKTDRKRIVEVRMIAVWEPTGKLAKVRLVPDLGEKTSTCLFNLIDTWTIPPSKDLSPLSVLKRIRLDL
jgi:hypothetical protein